MDAERLSADQARRLLGMTFDASPKARVAELAEKSQAGSLTAEEGEPYDECIAVADRLAILQSKAKQVLGKSARGLGA